MPDFVFDKYVRDTANGVRVDVTVVDADKFSNVQVNLKSGTLRIPFFLSFYNTRLLAQHLLQACDAYDSAIAAPESSETTAE